jgi:peptide/nickel transport system permease protein
MKTLRNTARELLKYPSAVVGLVIIIFLVIAAIYTLITIPYSEGIRLWRGGEDVWYNLPKNVPPAWVNLFRRDKLPNTIILDSKDGGATETSEVTDSGNKKQILTYTFDWTSDQFPEEIIPFMTSTFKEKPPFASITWNTPDGREIRIADLAVKEKESYRFDQDPKLQRRLGGLPASQGLFVSPDGDQTTALQGTYTVNVDGVNFEPDSQLEGELVLFGKVYGMAGTDHLRRDLRVALMWGIPVALAFGLIAALGTTVLTMLIAAIGVWYNGWVDDLIQRITEVNLVLPFLPILIMVATFYSRSIWLMLGVTILLSIFGGAIKFYRATFLQIKEAGYIEAARAYGANSTRMVIHYLLPRIVPLLIPQLVVLIPTYVYLEASLAVLGLGDPVLPTWGKIIQDAQSNGALYMGYYYWVLEPAILLMITGLAFALLGFALDRIFNPRLREI